MKIKSDTFLIKKRRISGVGAIEGTLNPSSAFIKNVSVDHGGGDIGMSEQFLHGAYVITSFE